MRTTIAISRQMGSGGSHVGQLIAARLGFKYVDREVLHLAAQDLGCDEQELEGRAERVSSFLERLLRGLTLGPPDTTYAPPIRAITDKQLFDKQTEIMKAIAREGDCVIVGWGGAQVLPRRHTVRVFCHAPLTFRARRVMELYHAESEERAREMILESDETRRQYIAEMTGKDWACAENYHLSVDTSTAPLPKIADLVIEFLKLRGIKMD